MDISIYRISYCSADATFSRVVAIICTNKNETLECHAFLTAKKKVAQAAALTISQAFTIAFENWQNSKNQTPVNNGPSNGVKSRKCLSPSHSNGSSKLNNDQDNILNDHNENKQPVVNVDRKKKDTDTLIDLSFEEVVTPQVPLPPVTSDSKHKQVNETCNRAFDVDLDDSFYRLAQSRTQKTQ